MEIERLYAIGKDMGSAGAALREWVDAERATERGLRTQAHEDQRVNIELQEKRLQAKERVLQLKLKLQEQGTSSNVLPEKLWTVISRLDYASASDYDQLKATLLLRFRYTADGYREKFRKAKPEEKETGLKYASVLEGHFDGWMEMGKVEKTYEALRDLITCRAVHEGMLAGTADIFEGKKLQETDHDGTER
ncbi:hypothetical protein HPB49_017486 [Dermacentor silvarum]|uniref:Uncharacterized protein n=1 Tax=Dermacentor silvarum TaxID=543639 RepID=A0ACB8CYU9_DERSI|nr:hypothetical protein HPB49_017486 [Dermacentor silvarum]